MCRRPKSREETPKEGGGNARTRIAALHQYAPASHKKQEVLTYLFTFAQGGACGLENGVGAPLSALLLQHRVARAEIDQGRDQDQAGLQAEHDAIRRERIDAIDGRKQI